VPHPEVIKAPPLSVDEAAIERTMAAPRHYLHGDFLELADRRPDSVVYCAFCDGFCLPAHLYEEHEIDQNFVRLNATKKAFYRTQQKAARPIDAPNYFDGTPDPI
jgi:hypothetical protein